MCFGRTCVDSGCMAKCMYQYGELKIFLHICYLKHKIGFCRCVVNGLSPLANMAVVQYVIQGDCCLEELTSIVDCLLCPLF